MDKKSLIGIFLLGAFLAIGAFSIFSVLLRIEPRVASYNLSQIIAIMDNAGIVASYLAGCFTIAVIVVGYIKRYEIKRWFLKTRFEGTGEDFPMSKKKIRAMVIPVSRYEQPAWILKWLEPEMAALIYTEQSESVAHKLQKDFNGSTKFIQTDQIKDPDDPEETKIEVKNSIFKFKLKGISADNIFVDVTGGKVPMSIGAFMAAEEEGVSTIYIVGQKKGLIKDPNSRQDGRPIYISYRSSNEENS